MMAKGILHYSKKLLHPGIVATVPQNGYQVLLAATGVV